ncbi:L-lactate permease [Ottowia thiooxydans]|uniref:L-lactate permease n=1 Tax=Ottowia thiooxydans TaxID=219182 RepID=UPI00048C44F2|nr:L-lactate permease [Ottowia thiooxydans]
MTYLLWSMPAFVMVLAICSGRVSMTNAAVLGLLSAIPIAFTTGPTAFGIEQLSHALTRGFWIGATIAPYILGGLFFWRIASHSKVQTESADTALSGASATQSPLARRRRLFFACFLVGPFAEAATGFGAGMLGTVTLIRHMGFAPRHLMVFGLLSQTMIPWGAMGSGTLLAAAYARIPASVLGLYLMVPISLFMMIWLQLFWRTMRAAGWEVSKGECIRETAWIATGLVLLAFATWYLGPETALLAAYGPLILLRYLVDEKPDLASARKAAIRAMPYVALISALVLTRLLPPLKDVLGSIFRIAPFEDLPAWSPLFHAGSWLLAGGVVTAWVRRQAQLIPLEATAAWVTGKHAVLTVFLFAMMAEVLSAAGISGASAQAMFAALHEKAILVTPLISSAFGILTNSGNAPNSLFMPSQLALAAQASLSLPAVAALQHVSGTAMSIFSPVRMTIAAGMAHGVGQERLVYRALLPYAACCLAVLMLGALYIAFFM